MATAISDYPRWVSALRLILAVGVILLWTETSVAQVSSSYADFQGMSLERLKSLQVKLTYVGVQQEPTPTVGFTSPFNTFNLAEFVPFRQPGVNYSNDELVAQSFAVSPEELKEVIEKVATLPNVTGGGISTDAFLSFAMLNTADGIKAFEAVLNKSDTSELFTKLRSALQSNRVGLRKLSEMACPLALLELERPADVTASVNVNLSGVRLNRSTGRFVGTAVVKNNSAQNLPAPVSIAFDFEGGVTLFNNDGTTCGTSPVGRGFINVPVTGNFLPPGENFQISLELNNPDLDPIRATTKVLAGPGAR